MKIMISKKYHSVFDAIYGTNVVETIKNRISQLKVLKVNFLPLSGFLGVL